MPGGRARGNPVQIFFENSQNFLSIDWKSILFFDIAIRPPFTWCMNFGPAPLSLDFSILGAQCHMTLSYFKNPVKFETAHAHLWFSVFSQKALTLLLPFNCLIPINWYSRSCQYILCGSNWAQQNCTSIDLSNENVFYQKNVLSTNTYNYVK